MGYMVEGGGSKGYERAKGWLYKASGWRGRGGGSKGWGLAVQGEA